MPTNIHTIKKQSNTQATYCQVLDQFQFNQTPSGIQMNGLQEDQLLCAFSTQKYINEENNNNNNNNNPEKITFVLQTDYPETPPHLYVNDIPYVNVINCCKLSRIKETVKKYTNAYRSYENCISCGSILTQENWSPKTRFSHILAENRKIANMKRIIKYDMAISELIEVYKLDYGIFVLIMAYLTV